MPTYEYACAACGNQWEEVQRITAAPTETCPKCSKSMAHRLISGGTNFILKGGGWYSDLYASPKADSKKTDSSSSGAAAEGAAKTETKAASTDSSSASSASGTTASKPAAPTPSTPSSSSA